MFEKRQPIPQTRWLIYLVAGVLVVFGLTLLLWRVVALFLSGNPLL